MLPPWKDPKSQAMIDEILKNKPSLLLRETRGIVVGDSDHQYPKKHIKAFRDRFPYTFEQDVPVLHTGIDPSGGGRSSDYALVTIAFENGKWVVSFAIYILI